jgi:hypothetical protein
MYSYVANRQPGKALQFFLRLRKPNVFDLIRDNNLFTDVQDQALLLVEFDQELVESQRRQGQAEGMDIDPSNIVPSPAIALLVDHTHSIPVSTFCRFGFHSLITFYLRFCALFNNYKADLGTYSYTYMRCSTKIQIWLPISLISK